MGSKLALLEYIIPKIEAMIEEGDTVLDLMAGTHAVGYALKPRHPIVANDVQAYSAIVGRALIENNTITTIGTAVETDILRKLTDTPQYSLFETKYTDTYFSRKQCADIDAIRGAIDTITDETRRALYLTALIYAMGYCQSSPGHFAQYMPKDHPRIMKQRELSVVDSFTRWLQQTTIASSPYTNTVLSEEYTALLQGPQYASLRKDVKLVYLDPPYSEAQYSRFYHLLETAVKYDDPILNHKGLYREERFQSAFSYRSKASGEFEKVVTYAKNIDAKIAISYSNKGLVSIEELTAVVSAAYTNVKVYRQPHKHSMQGRGMTTGVEEILITGE